MCGAGLVYAFGGECYLLEGASKKKGASRSAPTEIE